MPPWARFDSFCCEKGIAFEEEEDILKVIYKEVYCKLIQETEVLNVINKKIYMGS